MRNRDDRKTKKADQGALTAEQVAELCSSIAKGQSIRLAANMQRGAL